MITVWVFTRDGEVVPVSYTKEAQLQENADRFKDIIFFYPEDPREIQAP